MSRRKGSKNKKTLMRVKTKSSLNNLKNEIKELREKKNQLKAGSKERLSLHRRIKDLEKKLITKDQKSSEKQYIIDKILKIKPQKNWHIDLYKHSIEDLEKHYNKINKRDNKC